ncbi:MAG: type II secretion system F family protein, partial [Planctomycetota bacterium]
MAGYKYIARDIAGSRREGEIEAGSTMDVLSFLQERDWTPVSIGQVAAEIKKKKGVLGPRRIWSSDLSAVFWELTTMINGGIPLTTSLETISEDIENHTLQKVLLDVLERVEKGEPFSDSIAQHPVVFNQLTYAIILAGEISGDLGKSFRRIAEYYDDRDKLARKVRAAVSYPAFVIGFLVLIVTILMVFIIPQFIEIFEEFGSKLPAFTRGFIGFYNIIVGNGWYIFGGLFAFVLFCIILHTKTKSGHRFFSKFVLKLPLLGKILKYAFVSSFSRTMSTLLNAGVPMLNAFEILSTMSRNDVIKDSITRSKDLIEQGSSVSLGMMTTDFFPNLVIKMVQVGEDSGSLGEVLEKTAEHYERKVDSAITTLTTLLEPIMIITVGAIVLVVVIALYLP